MLGQIGADLVEGTGGDLCAVAQSRYQLAIVDDEPPESGLRGLRRAAIIPDFAENLIRGSGGSTLVFPSPHGVLLRFSSLVQSRDSRQDASTIIGVGNRHGHVPTHAHRARREKNEISTGSVT